MQPSAQLWPLDDDVWLQVNETFFMPAHDQGNVAPPALNPRLYTHAWSCTSCNAKPQQSVTQFPPKFSFCPQCGAAKTGRILSKPWMPPNGTASNVKLTTLALSKLTQEQTLEHFVRPAAGSFVFAYGQGGLCNSTHIAFDMLGSVWVWNDTHWHVLSPHDALLPQITTPIDYFTAPEVSEGWILPTAQGPVHLSINATTGQYHINFAPKSQCLAGAAAIDGRVFMPVMQDDQMCIIEFNKGLWTKHPLNNPSPNALPSTLQFALPIVDTARRHLMWVAQNHVLSVQLSNTVEATVYPLRAGLHAVHELGSAYQEFSTGHWWQQCYDPIQGYGFQKLSPLPPTPLDWKGLDSPVICTGHFTTHASAYTHREPWVESFYAEQDNQDFGFKLPLLQTQQPDFRGCALYLQIPYEGALDDFYKDTQTMYPCELRVTGVKGSLASIAVRQPWRTQVWVAENTMFLSHPDLHDIKRFESMVD